MTDTDTPQIQMRRDLVDGYEFQTELWCKTEAAGPKLAIYTLKLNPLDCSLGEATDTLLINGEKTIAFPYANSASQTNLFDQLATLQGLENTDLNHIF